MPEAPEMESGVPTDRWVSFRNDGLTCKCRESVEGELRTIYQSSLWIYDELVRRDPEETLRGRHPVAAGTIGQRRVVVKRLYHGGSVTFIGRDRFLTSSRVRSHIDVEEHLLSHGISTPRVVFASWRRVWGLVRGEVGFDRIEGGADADRHFFAQSRPPTGWEEQAQRIGVMVARLHAIDFLHADLNLMNFYFSGSDELFILDLDKTTVRSRPLTEMERSRNLARLERSIRKQGRTALPSYVEGIISAVRAGYEGAFR